jgi:hypothetical protein
MPEGIDILSSYGSHLPNPVSIYPFGHRRLIAEGHIRVNQHIDSHHYF